MIESKKHVIENGISTIAAVMSTTNTMEKTIMATEIRPLTKRWIMLGIFILFTFVNSVQWGQYIIISDAVKLYYNVTGDQVDNTMVVYMIAYVPLLFPALWLLDKMGTRFCIILGCAGLCAGAWIKVYGSMGPDRFNWVMVGQSLEAIFQVLAFGLAARVAALWFGCQEVALACSLAVFGDQFGSAFGFLLPAKVVNFNPDSSQQEQCDTIGRSLTMLNLGIAAFSTLIFLSAVLFFENKPKIPPSAAQAIQQESEHCNVLKSIKEAFHGRGFIIMMISYGINVASFNAFVALLNTAFIKHFPEDSTTHCGYIGCLVMIAGIFGSISIGILLDKTHLFKELTIFTYFCCFIAMVANIFLIRYNNLILFYISNIIIGCFMIGFYSIAIQLAIELKFPLSEGFLASLLLLCSHILGIPFTKIYRYLYDNLGDLQANLFLSGALFVGCALMFFIPAELNRQKAEQTKRDIEKTGS